MSNSIEDIAEQLPNVYMCWKDKNSCFKGCNENFAKLLGKTKAEIINNTQPKNHARLAF